jgi:aspartate racemase
MIKKTQKTIGILGGMGPEATACFFELVVKNTYAEKDQDHLKIIVVSFPQIPDRTRAILYGGENPVPCLIKALRALEKAGAELVAIPCLTAHYYLPELRKKTRLKIISLLEETALYIKSNFPQVKKVGLLATEGTIATGIFQKALSRKKIEVLIPSPSDQTKIMEAIYGEKGIKAGFTGSRPARILRMVADGLQKKGAKAIIAGCTEIPLALKQKNLDLPLINPLMVGARVLIKKAGAQVREKPVA